MKLHKMVNGKKVDLTDEEEAAVRAEWAENRAQNEKKRQKAKEHLEKQRMLRDKLSEMMGIPYEDVLVMLGRRDNELLGD